MLRLFELRREHGLFVERDAPESKRNIGRRGDPPGRPCVVLHPRWESFKT